MFSPRLQSIFRLKCPRCLEGDLFINPNPFNLKETANMHANCKYCGLIYEREPGYWYGAMYVSYAFTIAMGVSLWVAINVLYGMPDIWVYLGIFTVMLIGLAPWTFRTSRAIWLSFFVKFRPEVREKVLKGEYQPTPQNS